MRREEPGSPWKPCRPRRASESLRTTPSTAWARGSWSRRTRDRRTGRRRRPSPVAVGRVLGGRCRGRRAVMPAPGLAYRAWRLGVGAVRAAWNPATVRQPVLASRPVIAVRHLAAGPAVGRAPICLASAREATVSRATVDRARGRAEVRGELAWRAHRHRRFGRLAEPLQTRWYLVGAPQQLAVVVLGYGRPARPGPLGLLVVGEGRRVYAIRRQGGVRSVGTVASLAPRRAVRVTAEAGVAAFHQIPPGL